MRPLTPLHRFIWIAILVPIGLFGFIGILLALRSNPSSHADGEAGLYLLLILAGMGGAALFYSAMLLVLDRDRAQLEHNNHELLALRAASLDINAELSLDGVLQRVVDQARRLIATRYGALSVTDDQDAIQTFVTSGIDAEVAARIGPPPVGKGLLGIVLHEGQRLRIADIQRHPQAVGFPPDHPPMSTLLAVPILCRGPFRGNLYLADKHDGSPFTAANEETLVRFAAQAAIAVDNAHLHSQVRNLAVAQERLRLAREMHDNQAQVLAYVSTKAQAVQELLRTARTEEAQEQLQQLGAAAREVYADVREGILGLRTVIDSKNGFPDTLRRYVERWQDQCGIPVALELKGEEVKGEEMEGEEVKGEEMNGKRNGHPTPHLGQDVELQLLRILQESLTNIRKHAAAKRARVQLTATPERVQLVVEDDGKGFDPDALGHSRTPRFGLATMRERAGAIGATLDISSRPGAGTRVALACPLSR